MDLNKLEKHNIPEKFILRELSPNDWEKYRELRLTAIRTDPRTFKVSFEDEEAKEESYWAERLSKKDGSVLAMEAEDKLISIAASQKMGEKIYSIYGVYTLEKYRGKHLSTQLIQKLIEEAKSKGVVTVYIKVNKENETAIKLYEKLGFKIIDIEKKVKMGDGNLHDIYKMDLDLQNKNNLQ